MASSDLPVRQGYWWLLRPHACEPDAVWVKWVDFRGDGEDELCYDDTTARVLLPVAMVSGEWQGPVIPPAIMLEVEEALGLCLRLLEGKMTRDAIRQRRVYQSALQQIRVGHTWEDE